jgi:hypothetical protein
LEPTIPESDAEAIRESIFAGRKIEAIKHVRDTTGLDLAQAKTMVEQLEQQLRRTSPEKFTARPGAGCSSSAALFMAVAAVTIVTIYLTWN